MINEKRLKVAVDQAIRQRNYRRARERALTRLAQAFPDIYKAYLKEEKQNDKSQGKTWIDLDGNTNASLDVHSRSPESFTRDTNKAPSLSQDEGNQ